jgi:DNA polymerase-4
MTFGFNSPQARQLLFIDMDAFFSSVEQQCNPMLRGKSMGVVRKPYLPSVISAPSREAKRIGIKTGCLTSEALRIDRQFKIILEDPEKYVYASSRVFEILREYSPWLKIMSIDEGWIDVTQITKEKYGGDPRNVARDIKKRIQDKLGKFITASIGIAPSKLLSKYAGELDKPNGLIWIKDSDVPGLLEGLEVDAMCGINKGYKRRLNSIGIRTLADLGRCNVGKLRKLFGIWGLYLHMIGLGADNPMMEMDYVGVPRKGYGHSRVLRASETGTYGGLEENKEILKILCRKVARRMRSDGKVGRVVHFHGTSKMGASFGKQRALVFPTADEEIIFHTCNSIAADLIMAGKYVAELNGIGVHVTNLSRAKDMTLPLFPDDQKRLSLLNTIDSIQDQFGDLSIGSLDTLKATKNFNWNAQNRGMYRDVSKYSEFN